MNRVSLIRTSNLLITSRHGVFGVRQMSNASAQSASAEASKVPAATSQPVRPPIKRPIRPPPNMKAPRRAPWSERLGPDFLKIWTSYLIIVVCGITTFYFAKKEVDKNRQETMKIKKEIFNKEQDDAKYPSRYLMMKQQREEEKRRQAESKRE